VVAADADGVEMIGNYPQAFSAVSSAYITARASVSDSPLPARYRLPTSTQYAITSAATWRSSGSVSAISP
jgi:hypothetical protein